MHHTRNAVGHTFIGQLFTKPLDHQGKRKRRWPLQHHQNKPLRIHALQACIQTSDFKFLCQKLLFGLKQQAIGRIVLPEDFKK